MNVSVLTHNKAKQVHKKGGTVSMNTKQQHKEKGFTIIEVVLVLAIAGLIFLMVFIALPALQRSQRDTARKNDMSRAMTAITNFTTANRGALPTVANLNGSFVNDYLKVAGDTFTDPDGTAYTFKVNTTDAFDPGTFDHFVYYTVNATCNGESVQLGAGARKVAIQYKLEGGGTYCGNN